MKYAVYVCCEIGRIEERECCLPSGFSIVKKYALVYAENLPRFSKIGERIYGLPFGKTPNKLYLGTDRDGASEYSSEIRFNLNDAEKALLERMRDGADELCILRDEAEAEMFRGMLERPADYELIHTRVAGSDEPYPDGYELLGYDVSYAVDCSGAFSIICDCMFICRWHGCDESGTLFLEDFNKLNENGLFASFDDAYKYMVKYLNEPWAEIGNYSIFEVRGRKAALPMAHGSRRSTVSHHR